MRSTILCFYTNTVRALSVLLAGGILKAQLFLSRGTRTYPALCQTPPTEIRGGGRVIPSDETANERECWSWGCPAEPGRATASIALSANVILFYS